MCRSVRLSVLAADEIDRWPNPGAQVTADPGCGEIVDLVSQPAEASVSHPEPEAAILERRNG